MTVVFDTEPLLAFSFNEPGATVVEQWLDRVYDGELDGYIATINLAEFRYIATRHTSPEQADSHIDNLRDMGLVEYKIDGLWKDVSKLKETYNPALGDAYAIATAKEVDETTNGDTTLIVGTDDDYDVIEEQTGFDHLIERFRNDPA